MTRHSEVLPASATPDGPARFGRGYRAVMWSVALAALGYLAFSLWGGWRDVAAAAAAVGLAGFLAALSLSLANYGLRFLRWQAYLAAMGHPVTWRPSLRIYLSGFALTTTPGKAGETIRGVMLRRWGVPYPVSFAAFFSERLSDVLAVVVLALGGLSVFPPARPVVVGGAVLVAIGLFMLTSTTLTDWLGPQVSPSTRLRSLLSHPLNVLRHAQRCHTPALLGAATALSVLAWAAEAWAFYLVLGWMNAEVPLTTAVFVYAVAMLGGALSFMPGGLGGAEAIMITLLLWVGIGDADAVAATVIIRVATLWFAVLLGMVAAAQRAPHGVEARSGEPPDRQLN